MIMLLLVWKILEVGFILKYFHAYFVNLQLNLIKEQV